MFMREFILSVLLLLFLLPITSFAEDPVGFYMTGETSVLVLNLPDYAAATIVKPSGVAVGTGPYGRLKTNSGLQPGPMGTLSAGWRTKNGIFFEARGFASSLYSRQTNVFDYPTVAVRYGWLPIDGKNTPVGAIFSNGYDMRTSTTRDVDYYGGSALVGWAVAVKNGMVSPFAGISYMELNQDFGSYCYCIQDPTDDMSLEEDLDAKYLGILAGVRARYENNGLELRAEGKLGVYNLDADYDGFQDSRDGSATASETYSDMCVKANLSGGVTKRAGNWIYGANVGVEYLSAVPTIRSSTTHGATTHGRPSHLDTEGCFGLKGGLTITYAF